MAQLRFDPAPDWAPGPELLLRVAHLLREQATCVKDAGLRRQAFVLYSRLISEHPGYPRRDEALYWRGALSPSSEDARWCYQQIIKGYPQSPHLGSAWAALAEQLLSRDDLAHGKLALLSVLAATREARLRTWVEVCLLLCERAQGAQGEARTRRATLQVMIERSTDPYLRSLALWIKE